MTVTLREGGRFATASGKAFTVRSITSKDSFSWIGSDGANFHRFATDGTPAGGALFESNRLVRELIEPTMSPAEALQELAATEAQPVRVQILNEGAQLTNGSRDAEYGPPAVNLACAGELKAVIRKYMKRDIAPGELEAIDQVCTKLGRVATGVKPKRDTYVDGATYFAIAGEIALSGVDGTSEV